MLVADEKVKEELRKPFGQVLQTRQLVGALKKRKGTLVAVGDYSIFVLLQNGIAPDIAIYDFLCKRQPVEHEVRKRIESAFANPKKVKNAAGTITDGLVEAVEETIAAKSGAIEIDGEEDLAALVLMAGAPFGTLLIYGQPGEGAVLVKIGRNIKKRAREAMGKMHPA